MCYFYFHVKQLFFTYLVANTLMPWVSGVFWDNQGKSYIYPLDSLEPGLAERREIWKRLEWSSWMHWKRNEARNEDGIGALGEVYKSWEACGWGPLADFWNAEISGEPRPLEGDWFTNLHVGVAEKKGPLILSYKKSLTEPYILKTIVHSNFTQAVLTIS